MWSPSRCSLLISVLSARCCVQIGAPLHPVTTHPLTHHGVVVSKLGPTAGVIRPTARTGENKNIAAMAVPFALHARDGRLDSGLILTNGGGGWWVVGAVGWWVGGGGRLDSGLIWTVSHPSRSAMLPHTRRMPPSSYSPRSPHADWCLQSDFVAIRANFRQPGGAGGSGLGVFGLVLWCHLAQHGRGRHGTTTSTFFGGGPLLAHFSALCHSRTCRVHMPSSGVNYFADADWCACHPISDGECERKVR